MGEMKDSGIEWIGEIPNDWNCCMQKYVLSMINGRAFSESEFEEDGKYPILRVGNLFSNPVWYSTSLELDADKYCNFGDLLYSWSMSYAPIIWDGQKVVYHYHIWKVKLSDTIDKKFAFYYLSALTDALKAEIHETTMGFITMGVMNNSYIAFPTLDKQKNIATFLDRKCSEIDSLTADIESQIEALKQYKKSVITEVVTKGLDPDVEMKNSGIEWIGEIPKEWDTVKIKYVTELRNEKGMFNPETDNYIGLENVGSYSDQLIMTDSQYEESIQSICRKNDVMFGKLRPYLAKVIISPIDAFCTGEFLQIKKYQGDCRFLRYFLLAPGFIDMINASTYGTKMPRASSEFILNSFMVHPSFEEQKRIADFLDHKCSETDSIIADKQSQLDALAEYKKSLIYEYVTGKKEVPSA